MQLSAPTPPLDPIAPFPDSAGFASSTGKGDSKAFGSSDFGEMLSAESRSAKKPAGLRKADRSGSAIDEAPGSARPGTAAESLVVAAGVVPPVPLSTQPLSPVSAEIDLTFGAGESLVGEGETTGPNVLADRAEVSPQSEPVAPGRPFSGEMLAGKARAGIRAYGLNTDGTTYRGNTHPRGLSATAKTLAVTPPVSDAPAEQVALALTGSPRAAVATGMVGVPATADTIADNAQQGLVSGESTSADLPKEGGAPRLPSSSVPAHAGVFEKASPIALGPTPGGAEVSEPLVPSTSEVALSVASSSKGPLTEQFAAGAGPKESGNSSAQDATSPAATTPDRVLGEKIAAEFTRAADRVAATKKEAQRLTVTNEGESLGIRHGRIGIIAAKPEAPMPATATSPTPTSVVVENASLSSMPLSFDALVNGGAEAPASQASHAARRAVESVLNASEQVVAGDQRSVRLQFTIGGEDLAVRVEMRGDKVQTTFRTDSPELRSALAHEWQSVSAQSSGRTQRMADPVFASSTGNGQGMSSDSGAAHQRDSGPRNPQAMADEYFASRHSPSNTPRTGHVTLAPSPVATASAGNGRLHTFA